MFDIGIILSVIGIIVGVGTYFTYSSSNKNTNKSNVKIKTRDNYGSIIGNITKQDGQNNNKN